MRRNDRETEIRMMTMEEYLKKRQAIRRRGNMGENECHEKTAAALKLVELYIIDELIIVLIILIF